MLALRVGRGGDVYNIGTDKLQNQVLRMGVRVGWEFLLDAR